jgi:hypothetical protein
VKATHVIDPVLLDNAATFTDPFFRRFELRPAAAPLDLDGTIAKNYLFPTFYGDVTCAQAIYLCPWERAYSLMPHPLMKPVRMSGGRALVVFSCYVYRKVLGVAPYNEIAMTIPLLLDPDVNVPVLPMLWPKYPGFGYYVFSMPVTSLENRIRGNKIWGLPKIVADIDIGDQEGDCVTMARDEDGRPYFELRVPRAGTATRFEQDAFLYTRLGDKMLRSRTSFAGTFQVRKNMGLLFKRGAGTERPTLVLSDSPAASVLRGLQIEPVAFQTRYADRMSSCFDLPEVGYKAPATFR